MSKRSWYEIKAAAERRAAVYIYGDIVSEDFFESDVAAKPFIDSLNALDVDDIDLHINSPGGSVFAGTAIYNAIRQHPAQVSVHIDGLAASISSVIAMAGDLVTIADNALFMIHDPWTITLGNSAELRKNAEVLDKIKDSMLSAYERSSLSRAEVADAMAAETWYTAEEAVTAGFADEVYRGARVAACAVPPGRYQNAPDSVMRARPEANTKEGDMPTEAKEPVREPEKIDQDKIRQQAMAQAKEAERVRRAEVREVFSLFPQYEAVREQCMDDMDVTAAVARERLLAEMGKGNQPLGSDVRIEPGKDEGEKYREGMVQAIRARAKVAKMDGGNEFRGMRLTDMARDCLSRAGVSVRGMSPMEIAGSAFTHSTSDFPTVLEEALHKTLLDAYAATPDTWRRFCRVGNLSDFRPHYRYRMGTFGNLAVVNELGEFTHGTLSDAEREQIQGETKGKLLSISRKMIINDDLGAFMGLAQVMGRGAARTVEVDVYALLAENSASGPTMGDGDTLFHANHSNIVGTGAAPTVATFEDMRILLASQQDPDSNDYLDLRPAVWLGPIGLGGEARVVNDSQYDNDGTKLQKPNKVRGLVSDIVDTPRLTGTVHYMLASPAEEPVFEVGFLDGDDQPFLDLESGFAVDGVTYKVRLDYGVAAIGWRGIVKNPGA